MNAAFSTQEANRAGHTRAVIRAVSVGILAIRRYRWCKRYLSEPSLGRSVRRASLPPGLVAWNQRHLPGRLWTRPVAGSLTVSGKSELRRSTAAIVKAPRMSDRISNELRRGGKAAIMPRPGFRAGQAQPIRPAPVR